ncbi:MAG: hypothetical protein Rpha_0621 [Candidatus Ruthia sp. Apha_13_S6]|nr:hypothetical protein [Candidatus Ruthia sp. Apha_13_S6]
MLPKTKHIYILLAQLPQDLDLLDGVMIFFICFSMLNSCPYKAGVTNLPIEFEGLDDINPSCIFGLPHT